MNPIVQTIILSASAVRMLPHIALYLLHKKEIDADLLKVQDRKPTVLNLIKACTRERSFRNLFYYRMGEYRSVFISWLLPPERTMTIWCPHIGKGAHLEHSYATYLNAESIGDDFYCLQMVTLGMTIGILILNRISRSFAPSIFAASMRSPGTLCRPAT